MYGSDDPHQTLLAQNNHAVLLCETGKFELSRDPFQDVLERLRTRANLIRCLRLRGGLAETEVLLRELADDRVRVSGDRHPASTRLFSEMANLLLAREQDAEAREWVGRATAEAETHGE